MHNIRLIKLIQKQEESLTERLVTFVTRTIKASLASFFLAVSNLVKDQQEDHVARVARFAKDAVQAANQVPIDAEDLSRGYVQIRVGFHSGPVVSNVVGSLNPR